VTDTTTPALVGDRLPAALDSPGLMRALGLNKAGFYKFHAQGRFDRFLLPNAIGKKRFSGRLVQAYLDGGAGEQFRPLHLRLPKTGGHHG
jgi:hypothetical protein